MENRPQLVLLRWCIKLRNTSEEIWKSLWTGRAFLAAAFGLAIYWCFRVPSSGYAVVAMTVAAGIMALRSEISTHQKWFWLMCLFAFAFVEIRAIVHDKYERDKAQGEALKEERQHFNDIGNGIKGAIAQSQQQFKITMQGMEGLIEGEMAALVKGNETLMQTMGGTAYPMFYAMPPINHNDDMWPVMMATPGKPWKNGHIPTSAETAPLIDVTVDISEIPQLDRTTTTVSAEAFESQFLPHHYDLGTVMVPEDRTAPFKLQAGKKYRLRITTRRMVFVERIYFDQDEKAIGGWHVSECVSEMYTLYRRHTVTSGEKLIEGKCEN